MDGFKKLPKMQSFKIGGFVKRKEATVPKVPTEKVAKDTKLTNKKTPTGFVAEDKEAKLDISTLKKGGRAKKATGTVKKYKKGGEVTNVYEAKKSSGDKDNIKKVKDQKAKKLCGGKSVKKMADGGAAGLTQQATAQAGQVAPQFANSAVNPALVNTLPTQQTGTYDPNTSPYANVNPTVQRVPYPQPQFSSAVNYQPNVGSDIDAGASRVKNYGNARPINQDKLNPRQDNDYHGNWGQQHDAWENHGFNPMQKQGWGRPQPQVQQPIPNLTALTKQIQPGLIGQPQVQQPLTQPAFNPQLSFDPKMFAQMYPATNTTASPYTGNVMQDLGLGGSMQPQVQQPPTSPAPGAPTTPPQAIAVDSGMGDWGNLSKNFGNANAFINGNTPTAAGAPTTPPPAPVTQPSANLSTMKRGGKAKGRK